MVYLGTKKEELPPYISNLIFFKLEPEKKAFQKSILKMIFNFARITKRNIFIDYSLEELESYINDFFDKYMKFFKKYQSIDKLRKNMYAKVNKKLSEFMYFREILLIKSEAAALQKIEKSQSIEFISGDECKFYTNHFKSSKVGYVTTISICKTDSLPKELLKFKKLNELILPDYNSESFPDWIGELSTLKHLISQDCKIKHLPPSLVNLKKLETLNLTHSSMENLPDFIGKLENLKYINFSHSKITSIPQSFQDLKNLEKLYFACTDIKILPELIGNLENLVELSGNFEILPESIGNLTNLKKFHSSNIKNIPKSFLNLKNLKEGLIFISLDTDLSPEMIEFLEKLKIKDCIVLYSEKCYDDFYNNTWVSKNGGKTKEKLSSVAKFIKEK
ncbi:leucine-rich repeat domain-containing protein [Promethearchaeum syntrophicum]|uniref:Leucine-rich repeat domain-containing protein n=1 Tax=Promethearchaeum syntrophicum TaxID=2594042 RepID=A0A5B9DDI9_9ARCH|nr:leucine-rich repeat domain-containing protein [Candidatus Prometheoarchaeum syntrophicum]QEE16823.1 Leucine Rich repeats (2 copies) [Candidatus Prometheoarchaeum syntrophicum]